MPYIGKSPTQAVRQKYQYTATASQTTFSGSDANSLTLAYTDENYIDVTQNGVMLKGGGNDYTATTGTSVVLATGATANDVIEIIVYDVFAVADHVKKSGDTMTGSLDLNGTELVLDADADTSITADTDDQIDIKIAGSDSLRIKANEIENVSGDLTIDVAGDIILDADDGDIQFSNGGTLFGSINSDASSPQAMRIQSHVSDGDIIFKGNDGGSTITAMAIDMSAGGRVGIGTTSPYAILQTEQDTTNAIGLAVVNSSDDGSSDSVGISFGLARSGGLVFGIEAIRVGKEQAFTSTPSTVDSNIVFQTILNETTAERMRLGASGTFMVGKTASNIGNAGFEARSSGETIAVRDSDTPLQVNRLGNDGTLVGLYHATSLEGTISVSGSTVSYNGFSGLHESSGIETNTPIGTVVSTIDELDVYASKQGEAIKEGDEIDKEKDNPKAGQTRANHAKVEISSTVGDKAVYGVVGSFNAQGKVNVASVGIGSVRVTGACAKGDLLESNGDGTAKVQSDNIVRSKTLGKVTIGNSSTGVKLVSCVLYCG